jgi:UDP-N-acetylmuramate dehydrogenase
MILADYLSYKIGGEAEIIHIKTIKDLSGVDPSSYYILGGGNNILCNKPSKPILRIEIQDHNGYIGAGRQIIDVVKESTSRDENLLLNVAGIPGTVGGAIRMNASASMGAVSDNLIEVEYYDGQFKTIKKEDCKFGFRTSIFKNNNWIITGAKFNVNKEPNGQKILKTIQKSRKENYPMLFPSAGCVFKGNWGGRDIIRDKGLVGMIKGGAVISPIFPSFILNVNASYKDIIDLINEVVFKTGLKLEIEIWK